MSLNTFKWAYLAGAGVVWVALYVALAVIMAGTPYFGKVLPVLGAAAVWFVVIIPSVLRTVR